MLAHRIDPARVLKEEKMGAAEVACALEGSPSGDDREESSADSFGILIFIPALKRITYDCTREYGHEHSWHARRTFEPGR
jgi:hypothetical protein